MTVTVQATVRLVADSGFAAAYLDLPGGTTLGGQVKVGIDEPLAGAWDRAFGILLRQGVARSVIDAEGQ